MPERITIAGTAYHQLVGQNPFSISLAATMPLTSGEQVYSRVPPDGTGEGWRELSTGWLDSCSVCYLKNLEKLGGPRLEIGTIDSSDETVRPTPLTIPPGMISVLYPRGRLAIRCEPGRGTARYAFYAVPE